MTTRWKIFVGFLLMLAVAVNAGGYLLGLWHDETLFDEAVHAYTSFAVMAAVGTALVRRRLVRAFTNRIYLAFAAIGLLLGLLWEAVEWTMGIIGGRTDTLLDLSMDTVGALAAAALVSWAFPDLE